MNYIRTEIPDVVIIEPKVFGDERGYFFESFSKKEFEENIGKADFVQDNQSRSKYGVLRGLHYQLDPSAQAKLFSVTLGSVLDVAVDIRKGSPTYGKYVAVEISAENKRRLFVPRGFAHGFVVLSQEAEFLYKCDNYYSKEHEGGIRFDDPTLNIDWKIPASDIVVSDKDRLNKNLDEAPNNFVYNK